MALSERQFAELKKKAFNFLWDEVAPLEDEVERTHQFPRERLWPKMSELGMFGLLIPK